VSDDEGVKRFGHPAFREISGDRSGEYPVVDEKEDAADTRKDAARETLKGDADVVLNVVTEHVPVGVGIP
jgi:hypothetical protein